MLKLDYFDLDLYQHLAVDHQLRYQRSALWIDMGLGKTIITLTTIRELIRRGAIRRALVLAPLRVARKTWGDEIHKWSHLNKLKLQWAGGEDPKKRLAALRSEAHIHTINFHNLPWLMKLFYRVTPPTPENRLKKIHVAQLRKLPWDCIVIDESTNLQSTGTWWTAMKYLQRQPPYLMELTADAIPDSYEGLWSQMYLMDHGERLGGNITNYRNNFFYYDKGAERYELQETGAARIQKKCADICLTLREEDWIDDLPKPPEPNVRKVYLTEEEHKKYREMKRKFVLELEGKHITAVNAGVAYGKLLQLSNGTCYYEDKNWVKLHKHKLNDLLEYLPTVKTPIIIVYSFIPDRERIERLLTHMQERDGKSWRRFKSDKDEDDWNDGKIDRLLMHPKSGGHGLNMHHGPGEEIYWYGHTPSADLFKQMNGRLFGGRRRLAKPNGKITLCVADNTHDMYTLKLIERKMYNSAEMKEAMVELMKEEIR